MAEFSKLVITKKGQALLAKMIAGVKNINFTNVSSSNAEYTIEQLENLTSLSEIRQTSLISEKVRASDVTVKIEAAFNNFELTSGYYMRTLGLYAVDPDEGEILYGVTIETSGNCYIPPYNGVTVSGTYVQLVITVGNAENVSLEVNPGAIATIKQLNELANIVESHIQSSIGGRIWDVTCTYTTPDTETGTSGEYTIIADIDIQSEDYVCLRFVAPNDYVKDTSFAINSTVFTAVNAAFKANEIVTFNLDKAQQKCFFVSGGDCIGEITAGKTFTIGGTSVTAGKGAIRLNDLNNNIATGKYSIAMGYKTIASGNNGAVAAGDSTTASGSYSFAMGSNTIAKGMYSTAMGFYTIANAGNMVIGKYNKTPTEALDSSVNGDLFVIGNGLSVSKTNAFRVTSNGNVYGTKAYTASGADYAETFEWLDGNPDNEDRRGKFVTFDGEQIRLATEKDDYILGVVSATPSVVGDAHTDDWYKKWKTDIFGERLLDENGAWILNENFRNEDNENYISRLDRKEWAAVGLVGKLIVVDDGTCEVNGYCTPTNGGIATKSESGYRVLSRIDESHIKILIK